MKSFSFACILFLALAGCAASDFQKGLDAVDRGDFATALRELKPLAEQGHARAQYHLGVMYREAKGVPKDYSEALRWLRKAAAQGNKPAGQLVAKIERDHPEIVRQAREGEERHGLPASARVDGLVRYFDTIVFGAEIEKLAQKVIAKWDEPIRIAFQGRVRPDYRRYVASHLKTLAGLTGLTFQVLKPGQKGQNMDLLFVPRAQMGKIAIPGVDTGLITKLAAPGGCYFLTWKKPESLIVKVVIVVNSERDKFGISHCLLESISQGLGLPNDSDLMRPSLFSKRDQLTEPSRTDKILLKALYHPRMKAGLSRTKALRVARKVIAELDSVLP